MVSLLSPLGSHTKAVRKIRRKISLASVICGTRMSLEDNMYEEGLPNAVRAKRVQKHPGKHTCGGKFRQSQQFSTVGNV